MHGSDPFGWIGATIDGQFAVDAIAGEGAFGIVYRGTHLGFEAPIAIKCLKIPADLAPAQREDFLRKFQNEARLLHRLSRLTPGVVQALHIGAATAPSGAWTPYTIMEWLEGETLEEDLCRRHDAGHAPRSLDETIDLLGPAAAALAIAHEEKVSHRDVKPANLFLARTRAGSVLKIVDFGIAKVFTETPSLTAALAQTGKSFRAFTPLYGAPEQFSPRYGATGPWTDVYALALIFIEVASGRSGLIGSDMIQLCISSTDEENRPSLRARGVSADPEIEAVLARALAVSPVTRFREAGEMWAALLEARRAPRARPASEQLVSSFSTSETMPPWARDSAPAPELARNPATQTTPIFTRSGGENRVCTVMFVDLSTTTELSGEIDPEAVKDVFDRCFQLARDQVAVMGGIIEKPIGERAMAVFGLPRATDNDAERAARAALGIQASFASMPLPRSMRGARVTATIGITTGRVFAEPKGNPDQPSFTVIGDAVNVASRLQQAAPEGAIVVGRDAYRQVARAVEVEPLALVEVTGRSKPMAAYRVTRIAPAKPALAPSDFLGLPTKFVDRAVERQRLRDALETVISERRSQMVLLLGPPGVGRSRLLAELLSSLAVRSEIVFIQCSPLDIDTSYGLAAGLLRRGFGVLETDTPDDARRKLQRGVRWFRARGGEHGAASSQREELADGHESERELDGVLGQLTAIVAGTRRATKRDDSVALDQSSDSTKHRIAAALGRLLRFVASRMPLVIVCDDLQWADEASLDLIDDLIVRLADLPLLAVCAARPELLERRPAWGKRTETHERIDVAPLARRYIEEMARDRLQKVAGLSPELVRLLADRAEGSPLTLAETLHLLVDAGVIEPRYGGAWSVDAARLGALSLPATVLGVVQARLDRLPSEAHDALTRAAIVGRTFWEDAVDYLLRADAPAGAVTPTADLLASLRERELIRTRARGAFPEEREFFFGEAAIHEVAYETLSLKVRRALHLLVARWLEQRAAGDGMAALLALHYDRGGDARRAAIAYAQAGAHAASLGDNAEALRRLERARDLHDEARGDDPGASGEGVEDRRIASFRDRVRLRIDLGDVLQRLGRLDDATRAYEEARACVVRDERRIDGVLDPAEVLRWDARIDFRLSVVHKVKGATGVALELVERAIARAGDGDAVDETPPMHALRAFLHRRERRPEASWQAALTGLRVCRSVRRRDERWREDVAQLLFGIAAALFSRGRLVSCERAYRQASRVASEATSPHLVGIALNGVAAARYARGDLGGTREMFLRSLRLKERAGDLHQIAVAYSNLAEVELRMGETAAALDHARRSVQLGEQIRAGSDLADMYKNLAEASLAAGQHGPALEAGKKALEIAESSGRVYLGEVAATLSRICARVAGRARPDEPLFARAVEAARRLIASLSTHFDDDELRSRAEACRAELSFIIEIKEAE